jgi:hypothetical protein
MSTTAYCSLREIRRHRPAWLISIHGGRELSAAIHLATNVVHNNCEARHFGDHDIDGVDRIKTVVL